MSEKKKIQRFLSKPCPDCGEKTLEIVTHIIEKDGIKYSIRYEECRECEYSEELKKSSRHYRDVYNPKW
jgi:hypothetical protein